MAALVPDYEHFRADIVHMAIGEGKTNSQIGQEVGYPPQVIRMWLQRPEYKEAIKQYYEIVQEEVFRHQIVTKAGRIRSMIEDHDRLEILLAERAESLSHVPGGRSGLLVKEVKTVGTGPNAYDVAEYKYDSAVIRDRLILRKQIAQEAGQWTEKATLDVTFTEKVNVIRFVEQGRTEEPGDALDVEDSIEADFKPIETEGPNAP